MPHVYLLSDSTRSKVKICRARSHHFAEVDRIETDEPARCERHLRSLLEPSRIPGTREWFRLTRAGVAEAVAAGYNWADDDLPPTLEVRTLAEEASDGRLLRPDRIARDLYEELRRLKTEEYVARTRRLRVENELRLLIGTADGIRGLASWKSHVQRRFRQSDFRRTHERLFDRFVGSVRVRPFRLL